MYLFADSTVGIVVIGIFVALLAAGMAQQAKMKKEFDTLKAAAEKKNAADKAAWLADPSLSSGRTWENSSMNSNNKNFDLDAYNAWQAKLTAK